MAYQYGHHVDATGGIQVRVDQRILYWRYTCLAVEGSIRDCRGSRGLPIAPARSTILVALQIKGALAELFASCVSRCGT